MTDASNLRHELAYWINERDKIRRLKAEGEPAPWSDDPVFQTVYFCNVHREDDKVTRWIRTNWSPVIFNRNFELAMVMARLINWPPTLEHIGFPLDYSKDEYLQRFREIEGKKWGNAYVITTHGQKMDKDEYVFGALEAMQPTIGTIRSLNRCSDAYEALQEYDGLGSFLAAQVVADLKNSPFYPLSYAVDKTTFCAHGPGSLRGLTWFWKEKVTPRNFHSAINEAWEETMPLVDDRIKPIDMQDFQNCFCEFDKYMRVKTGTGRSKRRYAGTGSMV